jgi:hypothetical protein
MTTPRPRAVVIGSLSLFVVLFVLLTFQLSASTSTASAGHHKSKPAIVESQTDAAPEPEETEAEYIEPEPEYEEPEVEYVEPEVEEVPPVVTSSS